MPINRRDLCKNALGFTLLSALPKGSAAAAAKSNLVYIGAYSTAANGENNGKGIYLFKQDPATGGLTLLGLAADTPNPSWLALDPTGRFLYAANEVANFNGHSGSVTAFAVDRSTGKLTLLNTVSSEGGGPAHLSLDESGKYVFVANYGGGNSAVLPVLPTGALGPAAGVHQDLGALGAGRPTSAPPGSFAISGHDKPHAHMIHAAPGNRFVLQTDLAQDRIYVFHFDPADGRLTPAAIPFQTLPSGDGPRHFAFHSNGRWLYCLQEEASTVVSFAFDQGTGALRASQSLSTLPLGFKGTSFASELLLSPDGRFLYAANRLHDTIALFAVGNDGRLGYRGESSTQGDYPRHLQFAPGGAFLYACDQRSDVVSCFRVDRSTGHLAFTGQYTAVGSPACLVFAGR